MIIIEYSEKNSNYLFFNLKVDKHHLTTKYRKTQKEYTLFYNNFIFFNFKTRISALINNDYTICGKMKVFYPRNTHTRNSSRNPRMS